MRKSRTMQRGTRRCRSQSCSCSPFRSPDYIPTITGACHRYWQAKYLPLKNPTAIPKKRTLLEAFLHPGPNPLDVDEFLTFINQAPVAKSHSKSDEIFFKEYYSMWTKPF